MYVLVYVDDILVTGASAEAVERVVSQISSKFDIRDLGFPRVFLGMEITVDPDTHSLKLSQQRLTAQLVEKYGYSSMKPKSTPFSSDTKLVKDGNPCDTAICPYSTVVGTLLYLSVCTRPDITQAVGALSRFMSAPTTDHWDAAMGVLRYLSTTADYGIVYSKQPETAGLAGYSDADFAGDLESRRSTTGAVFLLAGGAISWSSRVQPSVAVSTTEAEYMAAAACTKEALWLRKLMSDFDLHVPTVQLLCDNQAAITLMMNPISSARSKHIDVLHHFVRERAARAEVSFQYISTQHMVADCMTKPLPVHKFIACRGAMGMSCTPA